MNLEIGSTLGDYQIIGILGAGGMGKVFKVRNVISDRVEAMKVLLPDLTGEPELADRFLREIKVLASLQHHNIAALHTALRHENQLLMLMELVEGVTLDDRLQKGHLPVPEAVDYIAQVLDALAFAHKKGVVHRDIKPANMMLTPSGEIKLMDFGIAKSASDRKLTMTGTTMGSLYYMSPEQIQGLSAIDARSDLYSVGVTLYQLVTGRRPFDGESQFAIMSAHLSQAPVAPITIEPSLPQALNDVILLSVAKEPGQRFQSAEAFHNALGSVTAAAAPVPVRALPAATTAIVPPPQVASRPRRGLWLAVGALCAVGAIVAAIEFMPSKKASAGKTTPSAQVDVPAAQPAPVAAAPPPVVTAATPSATPSVNTPVTTAPAPPRPATHGAPPVTQQVVTQSAPPVVLPPSAPQSQPAAVPATPVISAPDPAEGVRRAELQKLRSAYTGFSARASALHSTLQNLQRSQAASGLGLRRDWLQAASLMDSFLQGSEDAMKAGDVAGAKDQMDKAERQIDKLESALR